MGDLGQTNAQTLKLKFQTFLSNQTLIQSTKSGFKLEFRLSSVSIGFKPRIKPSFSEHT